MTHFFDTFLFFPSYYSGVTWRYFSLPSAHYTTHVSIFCMVNCSFIHHSLSYAAFSAICLPPHTLLHTLPPPRCCSAPSSTPSITPLHTLSVQRLTFFYHFHSLHAHRPPCFSFSVLSPSSVVVCGSPPLPLLQPLVWCSSFLTPLTHTLHLSYSSILFSLRPFSWVQEATALTHADEAGLR